MAVHRLVTLRQRIDIRGRPPRSLIHKIWSDGEEEFYKLMLVEGTGVPVSITKSEWAAVSRRRVPRDVIECSEWGDGF